jgi:hypothetical protein
VGASAFVATELALRYDGPIPQVGAPGPFTISRLQIRLGTTAVAAPGATFASNLTQPLTTVFDGPVSYLPDNGSQFPHPWGGTNNTLAFPFTTPATIAIDPGEWLVVELVMEGNNIASFGFAHAILDGAPTSGGISGGTATTFGTGCSAASGAPAATAATTGTYAPGGVHFLTGQNLGAGALAFGIWGLGSAGPLPLPGTGCSLAANLDLLVPVFADAAGAVTGQQLPLSLPASPALNGIVLSNAVAVSLGAFAPLGRGTYLVAHDLDADALHANQVRPFGYALRLTTL